MEIDPYRDWLHLADAGRPPNHYRLLGLAEFESDAGRIESAYGERMAVVRRYQVGAHMDVAQRVIGELSAAFACLTNAQQRLAYDTALRGGATFSDQPLTTIADKPRTPQPAAPTVPEMAIGAPAPQTSPPATTQAPPPVRSPAPVLHPAPVAVQSATHGSQPQPVKTSEKPAPAAHGSRRARSRQKQQQLLAMGGMGLAAVAFFVWIAFSSSPAPPLVKDKANAQSPSASAAQAAAASSGTSASGNTPAQPGAAGAKKEGLAGMLEQPPAVGDEVDFFGIVQSINGEMVVVGRSSADAKVVEVVFPGATDSTFKNRKYQPGDRVQVTGKVVLTTSLGVSFRVEGQAMQRDGDVASRIKASDLAAAPAPHTIAPDSSSPPLAANSTNSGGMPKTTSPAPKPNTSNLPFDWDRRVSTAESDWRRIRERPQTIGPGTKFLLAGRFNAFLDRATNSPRLMLQFGSQLATVRGPFSAEGTALLENLQEKDPVELELSVVGGTPFSPLVELQWLAPVGTDPAERVAFREKSAAAAPLLFSLSAFGLRRPVSTLAWSPDGSKLLVGSQPTTLWDAANGTKISELSQFEVLRASWSPDSDYVCLLLENGSQDTATVIDVSTGAAVLSLPTYATDGAWMSFNPKRAAVAIVHVKPSNNAFDFGRKMLSVISFTGGKQSVQVLGDFRGPARVAWNADGTQLAWAVQGIDSGIYLARQQGARLIGKAKLNFQLDTQDLVWVPNRNLVAAFTTVSLVVGDVGAKGKPPVLTLPGQFNARQCSFSQQGKYLASITSGGDIQVWDLDNPAAVLWQNAPARDRWSALAWSPTRPVLAALDTAGVVSFWNEAGQPLPTVLRTNLTAYSIAGLAWSPDGTRLAIFSQTDRVPVYDTSGL